MADSIDLSLLATTLGDYCRDNAEEMFSGILLEQPVAPEVTVLTDVTDEIPLLDLVSTSILKPYKEDFEPTEDALKFKPRIGKTRQMKADIKIVPRTHHRVYTAYAKRKGADPYNLPFEATLMEQIRMQAQDDMDTFAIFEGDYDADGDSPADTMTGWITHLENAQSETAFAAATTDINTITEANAVEEITKLVRNIPSRWLKKPMNLYCSPTVQMFYELNYRERFGALPYNREFKKVMIDGTMISFRSHSGISAMDKIYVTPPKNKVMLFDSEDDIRNLIVEKFERKLKIMLDLSAGVDFVTLDRVWYAKNKA